MDIGKLFRNCQGSLIRIKSDSAFSVYAFLGIMQETFGSSTWE